MGDATVGTEGWATIALAVRTFGILLFGAALTAKARHRGEFVAIVARYLDARPASARLAALTVIGMEAAVVGLLVSPRGNAAGGVLASALLLAFAGAMAAALRRGERELDCGCGWSDLRQRVRWALVARNVALAGLFALLPVAAGAGGTRLATVGGIGLGILLTLLNVVYGTFVALDDSFAELKRRYG